jgi:hypothetical protein
VSALQVQPLPGWQGSPQPLSWPQLFPEQLGVQQTLCET